MSTIPCPRCGQPLPPWAAFCGNCGARLQPAAPANAPGAGPVPVQAPIGNAPHPAHMPGNQPASTPPAQQAPGMSPGFANAAPRKRNGRLIVVISAALLVIIVGGVVAALALGGKKPTGNTVNPPGNGSTGGSSQSIPTKSTVRFTASGGLSGSYTISDNDRSSSYRGSGFEIIVQDQTWLFTLGNTPYTGPGAYTLTGLPQRFVVIQGVDGAHRWQLTSPATCPLSVTADTALKTGSGGPEYHEVKGTFSCPSLAAQSAAPLALSNGQLDIVALVVPT